MLMTGTTLEQELKSVLIAIREVRGKRLKDSTTLISSLSFNLIYFDNVGYRKLK